MQPNHNELLHRAEKIMRASVETHSGHVRLRANLIGLLAAPARAKSLFRCTRRRRRRPIKRLVMFSNGPRKRRSKGFRASGKSNLKRQFVVAAGVICIQSRLISSHLLRIFLERSQEDTKKTCCANANSLPAGARTSNYLSGPLGCWRHKGKSMERSMRHARPDAAHRLQPNRRRRCRRRRDSPDRRLARRPTKVIQLKATMDCRPFRCARASRMAAPRRRRREAAASDNRKRRAVVVGVVVASVCAESKVPIELDGQRSRPTPTPASAVAALQIHLRLNLCTRLMFVLLPLARSLVVATSNNNNIVGGPSETKASVQVGVR